ncbi:MAG: LamG domain-containing protein, partial [Planctomycetes bacterium]|nr:LamG domain-containing protein [Planctomycetota bacterium]
MPSSIVGFIVSFKSIEPFEPRTASELLDPFNENHPDGVRTHHFRTEVRGSKLIGHICVDNNAGKDSLAKALERSDLLTLVKIRAVTQKEFEEHCLLGQPSLPFVSTHNKEILGPWQTVDYIRTIESFNPEKPYSWGNFLLKGLTFYEDGSTSDVWTWEESWLWHPKNKTRLSYEIRRIDGAPYLFIEWDTRSVAKRENKPRYYVMKKVTQNGNVSPIAFADNLPVDGIVVRGPQCTAISVQTVLGPPARIDGRFLRYTRHGFDLIFSTNGLLGEIHLNRGFKGRLDTGISLASTKQDVFRVYGEPVEIIRTTKLSQQNDERILRQNGNTSRIYYGIDGLIFWFDGDSVSQIVVFRGRMKSSSLPADQPLTSATAALEFISTDPPSPAVLKPGEKLNVKFRYDLGAAQRVHIWAMPRTNARFTPGHKIQPSGQYQRSITRSGVASGYILFDSTAHVDEVWIYMKDMSSGKTIASILHKVSATWTETKDEEPSLVAHWKFDEGSGNIAYDSAGNSHGKVYDAKWTKGKAGGALHFDGSTDYVIAEMAATSGNATYALWFSADDVNLTDNSLSRILSRYWMQGDGGSVSIALIKGELAVASRRADAIYANPLNGGNISAGTWYHLAFVFDGTNIALYLNG